ncbi:MAG: Trm112 family protein [Gammaproteobacteria bacterium]|nr:Trm112 family protein [Gammaproteobacteria bacterium]MYH47148.1 Trm112 family protein [Gammaproteobacteria bacterium]MYL14911.1 Trm112 family protein [Gammaproteobacteria bacterium]
MNVDRKLLAILVCPICKGELRYDRQAAELLCAADGLAFPIRDGVPVMLPEEAREMSFEEREKAR